MNQYIITDPSELEKIAELKREKLAQKNHRDYRKYKPYPFRLCDLKEKMQHDAFWEPELLGNTIHAVGIAIIRNYYEKREVVRDAQFQKLIEMVQIRRYNIKHHIYRKKYGNLYSQLKLWV